MKSKLAIALVTSALAGPAYAQFLGGPASEEHTFAGRPPGETPVPEGRTPDRSTKPPQQVDFSAPEQIDFSMSAAPPQAPLDPRNDPRDRTPARRTPGSADRAVDHLADEAVDSAYRRER